MKFIPELNENSVSKDNLEEFKGLNENERIQNGEWSNMLNMKTDDYPVASTRKNRGIISNISQQIDYDDNEVDCKLYITDNPLAVVNNDGNVIVLRKAECEKNGTITRGKALFDRFGNMFNLDDNFIEEKDYTYDGAFLGERYQRLLEFPCNRNKNRQSWENFYNSNNIDDHSKIFVAIKGDFPFLTDANMNICEIQKAYYYENDVFIYNENENDLIMFAKEIYKIFVNSGFAGKNACGSIAVFLFEEKYYLNNVVINPDNWKIESVEMTVRTVKNPKWIALTVYYEAVNNKIKIYTHDINDNTYCFYYYDMDGKVYRNVSSKKPEIRIEGDRISLNTKNAVGRFYLKNTKIINQIVKDRYYDANISFEEPIYCSIFGENKNVLTRIIKYDDESIAIEGVNPYWIYYFQRGTEIKTPMKVSLKGVNFGIKNIENNLSLFDKSSEKCSIIKNSSKLIIIPDGVIVDTKTKKTSKIAVECKYLNIDMHTAGNQLLTYKNTGENARMSIGFIGAQKNTLFRVVGDKVQENVLNNGNYIWSNIDTFVCFSTSDESTDFRNQFNEGDVVELSFDCNGNIDKTKFTNGLLVWDKENQQFITKKLKIIKVEKNYIDFENTFIAYPISYDSNGDADTWTMGFFQGDELGEIAVQIELRKKFPDVNYGCESQNRIWLTQKEGHEIYASALGDATNYYDYSGLATDSYAVNVGTDGKFTGCVSYQNTPMFFKEDSVHIIGGSLPSEYYVTTITDFKGCESGSDKSFAIIDGILYYKSPYGIVAYDGGNTTVISNALNLESHINGIAGVLGNKYYISLYNIKLNQRELFCYDTKLGTWCKEDNGDVLLFVNMKNNLAYVSNRSIGVIDGEKETNDEIIYESIEKSFPWSVETGVYGYSYPNQKYISRLQIRMYLAAGTKVNVFIQYNSSGIWESCGAQITGRGINSFVLPIRTKKCDHMKLKIEGVGQAKIYSISKLLEIGGEF